MFEKDFRISYLLDFYGNMLTEKQKDAIDLYYNEDLSLSEIAEYQDITRQGVRDAIKRGEEILTELEEKLGFAGIIEEYTKVIGEVYAAASAAKGAKNKVNYYKALEESVNLIADKTKNFATADKQNN